VTKKNIKILQIAILIPFAIFWFNSGGYHFFFDFLQKPTPDRELFYYLIIFMLGSGIVGWAVQKKRNKIKHRIRVAHQKPEQHVKSTIKASKTLSIPQESIDQLEKTRKTYIWLFLIASTILFYMVLTGMVLNADFKMEGKTGWRIFMMIIWIVPSVMLAAGLQWNYSKKYNSIYVDSILSNLQDVNVSVIDQSPKVFMKKYLPGMPYGQINGSETLVLVTDQYSSQATSVTIVRNNDGGGAG
jgi:ABC-type sugar transport system permease subunit